MSTIAVANGTQPEISEAVGVPALAKLPYLSNPQDRQS